MAAWPAVTDPRLWLLLPGALGVSALLTFVGIRYAERRQLLDHPGQRRSHSVATPRGGGIGIVAAAALFYCVPLLWLPSRHSAMVTVAITLGLLATAAIGWSDDHRPLSARLRFAVHIACGLLLALGLVLAPGAPGMVAALILVLLLTLATAWSINLHNFMDGINGLLACQALFVFATFAGLSLAAGQAHEAVLLAGLGAATLGFLPFNFPRARVFMGDVGSGAIGFLVAAAIWSGSASAAFDLFEALIVTSAFVGDASATLLSRMWRGRRWYSAHREHLYQCLVRSGRSHTEVVGFYMSWNFMLVLPALALYRHAADSAARFAVAAAVALLGLGAWWWGKRHCLRSARIRRHAAA